MFGKVTRRGPRRSLPKIPNDTVSDWSAGYMAYTDPVRGRLDALSDMLNADITQDGVVTQRPGTVRYGAQPLGKVIGVGTFTKLTDGMPEKYQITMQVIKDKTKLCINKDGGAWQQIDCNFHKDNFITFTQSNNRVYITNHHNRLAFYDINTGQIEKYVKLAAPAKPKVTAKGLDGSVVTYRVRVSANNKVGETMASEAALITVGAYRDDWKKDTQHIDIEVDPVEGAESYNIYIGRIAGKEEFLTSVPKPVPGEKVKFKDNNRMIVNPFRKVPEGDSTEGPILGQLIASEGQLIGLRDKENAYRLWYSAGGKETGDFSPFNGGGWVDINYGSETIPMGVKLFRDGLGKSALTVLTKGGPSGGEIYHITFAERAYGDFIITYPQVSRSNGSAGTYSPMAVVEHNNSLIYPTNRHFKTTGTKAQMVNILVTDNITDTIADEMGRLSLNAMHKAVGLSYNNRVYFCLPVGSDSNNEIWVYDNSRRGVWILRWTLPADFMWLYEDNEGKTHHCVLVNNKILEFDYSTGTVDDGVPFTTRVSGMVRTFDKTGTQMAAVEEKVFVFLRPRGNLKINIYGLSEDGSSIAGISSVDINPETIPTDWSDIEWSYEEFSRELPDLRAEGKDFLPVRVEVDETVCQLGWDIITEGPDAGYVLHAEKTTGNIIPNLFYGED